MKLTEILNYIQQTLKEDNRLNSVICGDVYSEWNNLNSSKNYTSAVIDFQSDSFNGEYMDYTFIMYVGSVIAENQKNIYPLISIADSIIAQALHKIDTRDNELILVVPNIIQPFVQKFADVNCGCYVTFTIRISIEPLCE